MAGLTELLVQWAAYGAPASGEAAQISIAMRSSTSEADLGKALAPLLGGHAFTLAPAFSGVLAAETQGRFWLVTFPGLTALRTEAIAFEVARELRHKLDA